MVGTPTVVLDVGASKVLCLVGERQAGRDLKILGMGSCSPSGLRRGAVVDMPKLVESIRHSLAEAERTAGVKITGAFIGLAGHELVARTSRSAVAIAGVSTPIDEDDVNRALAAADQDVPANDSLVTLHRVIQTYAVDGEPVQNPLWLHGNKLEVQTLTVAASRQACTTLSRAVEEAGIDAAGFILETVATAGAVVSTDEQEMGVAVLDIGAGSSDLAIFHGQLRHVAEIPFGGDDITNDLSLVLNMTRRNAEQLKREYGCVCCDSEEGEQSISFQTTAMRTRTQTRFQLSQIIEARQREIFEFVRQEVARSEVGQKLAAGMVITGGGALLQNLPQLGEQVLGMQVRIGLPQDVTASEPIDDPHYATSIGLLRFAVDGHQEEATGPANPPAVSEGLREKLARLFSFF